MDHVLEREPVTKKMPEWVPVIFANGIDDDTPGLLAAMSNEKVQFGEKIYQPTEGIYIRGKDIRLRQSMTIYTKEHTIHICVPDGQSVGDIIIHEPPTCRDIHFNFCHFGIDVK